MRRQRIAIVLAAAVAGLALACSSTDGRTLPPPASNQTITTPSAPVIQPPTGELDVFSLTSTAFDEGSTIPERLTCTGADISPALSWTGAPLDALELAIVVRDTNAGGFVHWVVTGIDPFVQGFGEGGLPENAVEHRNDAGTLGWLGPCPPAGSGTHTYEFVLHALPALTAVPDDATGQEAASLLEASSGERAVLTGTVTPGGG